MKPPIALLLLPSLLPLAGCAHKVMGDTPYYKKGPYQVEPPDGDLKDGTWVWIVGAEGSYKHVVSATGVNAYIWSHALVPVVDWNQLFASQPKEESEKPASPAPAPKPRTSVFLPPDPQGSNAEEVHKRDATTAKQKQP